MCHRSQLGRVLIKICVYGNMSFFMMIFISVDIYGGEEDIYRESENASAKSSQAMPPFASVCASYRQSSHFIGPT